MSNAAESITKATCDVCPRHCRLADGALGFCHARRAANGKVVCENYGHLTSLNLDPIEKKPLAFFHPGKPVLSIGSYGCNLRCPFCQNETISQRSAEQTPWQGVTLEQIAFHAKAMHDALGNIGLAYTYNEPLVGWEWVRDCAKEIRARKLCNVLVSNGCASEEVVAELAPLIDAANIDLKGPSQDYYNWVEGDFESVCRTIRLLHQAGCHVEVTTLVVPGRNDKDSDIDAIAGFIASISSSIPLHITRFFPMWKMCDAWPTPIATIHNLVDVAKRRLRRVLAGNC